jgi:hypothetical protein
MKSKPTLTTLIATAGLLAGAAALAQKVQIPDEMRTSTPGAGCTATANAMRGGNLGGSPNPNACADAPATAAAVAPAGASGLAGSSAMGNTAAAAGSAPAREPRADRN